MYFGHRFLIDSDDHFCFWTYALNHFVATLDEAYEGFDGKCSRILVISENSTFGFDGFGGIYDKFWRRSGIIDVERRYN